MTLGDSWACDIRGVRGDLSESDVEGVGVFAAWLLSKEDRPGAKIIER